MDFPIFPCDRKRPHLHPPQAQTTLDWNGLVYGLRALNGLLFLRAPDEVETGETKTLVVATPLTEAQETEVARFPDIAARALRGGDIARFVVGYDEFLGRTLPLFLRADGTGFCREFWNRDDLEFRFQISMHDWMEGADENLAAQLQKVFYPQLHPQLSAMEDHQSRELEWICGSLGELKELATWICHLEKQVWREDTQLLEVELQSENEFGRAGVRGWTLHGAKDDGWSADFDGATDKMELWSRAELLPSRRFLALFDLAIDENTPTSLDWEYHDQGVGRCSNAPQSETISLAAEPPTVEAIETARREVRAWLQGKLPAAEIETAMADDAPADLPKFKWFDALAANAQ